MLLISTLQRIQIENSLKSYTTKKYVKPTGRTETMVMIRSVSEITGKRKLPIMH